MRTGCFISAGRKTAPAIERVKVAESLGYEACFTTHIAGHESLTLLTAFAAATERIKLGTGVVPIYTRTPATMAQTAATIDEISGGRMVLGLGVSHRLIVENWHGQTIDKPTTEMREYTQIVRAILGGTPPPQSSKWPTNFGLSIPPHPDVPIYIAALSPKMLELAGEIGDGVLLWLCNPQYIEEVVVPAVTRGRERAGKTLEGFEIVPAVPSGLTDDPAAARDAMRKDLIPYLGLPFYRTMLERSGFADELAAYDSAAGAGDADGMAAAASDALVGTLAAIGSADDIHAGIARYRAAGATLPSVGSIPGCDVVATLEAAISN